MYLTKERKIQETKNEEKEKMSQMKQILKTDRWLL
jgi:hypothetical protein